MGFDVPGDPNADHHLVGNVAAAVVVAAWR